MSWQTSAPGELARRALTDPEHCMRWWGPADFTSPLGAAGMSIAPATLPRPRPDAILALVAIEDPDSDRIRLHQRKDGTAG